MDSVAMLSLSVSHVAKIAVGIILVWMVGLVYIKFSE